MGMTKQRVYDTAKKGMLSQGKRSVRSNQCKYRGDNYTKCGVGFLIPDELYEEKMEGNEAYDLMHNFEELAEYIGLENLHLLEAIQGVHDLVEPALWSVKLAELAKEFKVKP